MVPSFRVRFSLAALLAAVALIACILAALQRWIHVPMRTGTLYTAICRATDFEKLASSRPAHPAGDFTMRTFASIAPQDLFIDFSPRPQLWHEISLTGPFAEDRRARATHLSGSFPRYRRADALLHQDKEPGDPACELVNDLLSIDATFRESAIPPRRCIIDCRLALTLGIRYRRSPSFPVNGMFDVLGADGIATKTSPARSRLRYSGNAPRGLMVFSRPIDDELVQLLILDLR